MHAQRMPRERARAPLDTAPTAAPQPSQTATLVPQPSAPPEARELASLFEGVCQMAALPAADRTFGCTCCAPFDGCRPGAQAEPSDLRLYFPSESVAGAFTRAGAEQRAMPMEGCEPHTANYGGMVVLERRNGVFELERYVSALNGAGCRAVRRDDGRDLLLCARRDVHQGYAATWLFQWDLSGSDEQLLQSEELLAVEDNEMAGCWSELGSAVSSAHMAPLAVERSGGRTELIVEVETRAGKVSREYLARCTALEQAGEGENAQQVPRPRLLFPARKTRVRFRFDGTSFVRR